MKKNSGHAVRLLVHDPVGADLANSGAIGRTQVGRIMRALMFLITESVWKVSDIQKGAKGRADSEKELRAQ